MAYITTVKAYFPLIRPLQPGNQTQEGRFAASRWPQQAYDTPLCEAQGYIPNRRPVKEFFQVFDFQ
jgi:hypothetical protein